jgi:molybdate transport system ATP-binding protein
VTSPPSSAPATASPAGGALEVEVRKRYATSAAGASSFHLDLRFTAAPGVTVLLGPSGAGKTTVLRCVAGLCDPEAGRIAAGGLVLFDAARRLSLPAARRRVGFVFQDLALFPHLTVEENVAYGLHRLERDERERRASAVLAAFQISHLRRRLPREVSGGEQQRTALARSLVTEPAVLLLDEPLSSLDGRLKTALIDDLLAWNEAHRIPILYVTHQPQEAFALGDHAIAIEQGRIVEQGVPREVMAPTRREALAQAAGFDNLLAATVTASHAAAGTMTCRLAGAPLDLELPLARVPQDGAIRIGIRPCDVLLALERPALAGACNVLQGRIAAIDAESGGDDGDGGGHRAVVRLDCAGVELRIQIDSPPAALQPGAAAWAIVAPRCCHPVRALPLNPVQRLFVFVCSRNTSRSPIAQAICNAEIARRLNLPPSALTAPTASSTAPAAPPATAAAAAAGVRAVSAGLAATAGEPMSAAARQALQRLGVAANGHRSQPLTAELVERAEAIFCMTRQQCAATVARFPAAAAKTACLLPSGLDLAEPDGHDTAAFGALAQQIQSVVRQRLETLVGAGG